MKIREIVSIALALLVVLTGCEKDNFEAPKSTLTGRVVYQDQAIGLRSNGVQLELWQPGYDLYQKIPVYVDQDGSFSASLFEGNYKLVLLRGNGPWADNSDTIEVQLKGSASVDVPVQPYFLLKNEQFQKSGDRLTATCQVEQIVAGRSIDRVMLFLSTTQFVDDKINALRVEMRGSELTDLSKPVQLSATPSAELAKKGYMYARLGIQTKGVPELLYTPVQKIEW